MQSRVFRWRYWLVLIVGVVALSATMRAANDPKEEQAVMAAMKIWHDAMIAPGDPVALEKILHPDLMFNHSTGAPPQTKAEQVEAITKAPSPYAIIDFTDTNVHIYGTVALVKGTLSYRRVGAETTTPTYLNTLFVLVKGAPGWQIVARQPIPITAAK